MWMSSTNSCISTTQITLILMVLFQKALPWMRQTKTFINISNREMTQEEKDLLLKDLCARLPYGVKVESVFINPDTKEHKSCGIEVFNATSLLMIRDGLGEFKPYLFPLSSMTEEQIKEFNSITQKCNTYIGKSILLTDFCNKHHIDWRGFIEKGLALDATGLDIYE